MRLVQLTDGSWVNIGEVVTVTARQGYIKTLGTDQEPPPAVRACNRVIIGFRAGREHQIEYRDKAWEEVQRERDRVARFLNDEADASVPRRPPGGAFGDFREQVRIAGEAIKTVVGPGGDMPPVHSNG